MKYITSLKTFPTMGAAYAATMKLYDLFKKAHKRAEKVDLFVSSSGDTCEIRVHATRDHQAEVAWFVEAAKSL
jgi:hypothetical protein